MNAKIMKIVRRYSELYPEVVQESVIKALKKRWKAADQAGRGEIRNDMTRALATPSTSQANILQRFREIQLEEQCAPKDDE